MADLLFLSSILPEWPSWAVKLLFVMTAALSCTLVANYYFYTPDDMKETEEEKKLLQSKHKTHQSLHAEFDTFRRSYLSVYLVIMLADWMQGTHMYTLYLSYNVNISALFLTGFLTGAIFAPFLGSLVDKFGRKRSCIIYCILEIMINWIEHYNDFRTLLLGRILGGISTNLLFSAFESWMATEHRKRGFPEEWMARTYSEVCMCVMCKYCMHVFILNAKSYSIKFIFTVLDWERCHCHISGSNCSSIGGCAWPNWSISGCHRSYNTGAGTCLALGRELR